ncbi:MAG: osmotically inducible protein OsmC [Acidiphilium sp. 37-64-53]|uniref:organic hydroperoxide resistance protein n=1 Tax=Acidiphilium TaxID=522 RepID=UPI000BD29E80|nr:MULTISPECIES: organic hydroperoxide resistance protein [Acidiphilium]OYW02599.1 MAG: osmotically inducible protein OsmC [Acidiphilium sp. 37-64-53]OZB29887.1 MAG: osmotically inducible protein OsmC [Acidiphilium sp. 34-64-41]HQT84017.1 organic hydroperoxide resistance protein [Acidiphilium rubrum]
MKTLYHAHGHATGGRTGHGSTDDGKLDLDLSTPKELGGDSGPGTNPEQLFAVGFSACFLGALKFVAGQEKVKVPPETKVTADIGIGPRDDGAGFGITAHLTVSIPGMDKAQAEDLVKKAEIVCPYAHATRGNIDSRFTVA